MLSAIELKHGAQENLEEMKCLFKDTILSTCRKDYSERQVKAWAKSSENSSRWLKMIENQFTLLAYEKDKLLGFISLKRNYLDMLYVNRDFQGNGLAKLLLSEIELEAFRLKEPLLISDVSITAKPFFEKSGFQILQEQNVIVQGIEFVNYRMQKSLI